MHLDALLTHVLGDASKTRILNCSWGVARSAYLDAKFESLNGVQVSHLFQPLVTAESMLSLVTPAGIDGMFNYRC